MTRLHQHPRYRELLGSLKAAGNDLRRTWNGPVFRCVELKWSRPDFLVSGLGTIKCGGRWMRSGVTPVVHAASSEAISLKESRRAVGYFNIRRTRRTPRVSIEIEASFQKLADLTRLEKLLAWPTLDELLQEDWEKINARGMETLSQALGHALWELEFEGLIVPSARDRRGRILIWFPENLGESARVRISGETQLTKWITTKP